MIDPMIRGINGEKTKAEVNGMDVLGAWPQAEYWSDALKEKIIVPHAWQFLQYSNAPSLHIGETK